MRWMIYFLIAFSPLPFASNKPVWQWFWVVYIGLMLAVYLIVKWRTPRPKMPLTIKVSVGLIVFSTTIWGFVQSLVTYERDGAEAITNSDTLLANLDTISIAPSTSTTIAIWFLSYVAFFYLVYSYASRRDRAVELVRFIGIVVALYSAYAFAVYVSGNDTILWYERDRDTVSLSGPFLNRNSYAAFAGLGLLCLLSYASFWLQEELQENRSGQEFYRHILETMLSRAWWLPLAIILVAVCLLLSRSRAGFASVAIATLIWMVLSANRYNGRSNMWSSVASLLFFSIIGIALFSLSGEGLDARLQANTSFEQRFVAYPIILDAIEGSPFTGFGLGSFDDIFRLHQNESMFQWFDRAHNDYIEFSLTAGIPAAALVAMSFLLMSRYLIQHLKFGVQYRSFIALGIAAIIQLALHSLVDFSLQKPAVAYLWVAILAVSISVARRAELSTL